MMKTKRKLLSHIISLGLFMGIASAATATEIEMPTTPTQQFRRIEQPLGRKVGVTLGGIALIGAELWWFLGKKRQVQQATIQGDIQELTVTVDGGYQPDYIVVQAGQPVRLNFLRKDANSCLEEVLFPDFGIAAKLPLNQTTPVEFTPPKSGEYEFTCGMRMYRGIVAASSDSSNDSDSSRHQPKATATMANLAPEPPTLAESVPVVDGVQEVTINVDGGYKPARIAVQVGKPVRLNFFRNDQSECLSQVVLPDFGITADLPLNETKTVEFTPQNVGEYPFTCGMDMVRGVVDVQDYVSSN
jgi:plastocyanin domain-containing protein